MPGFHERQHRRQRAAEQTHHETGKHDGQCGEISAPNQQKYQGRRGGAADQRNDITSPLKEVRRKDSGKRECEPSARVYT